MITEPRKRDVALVVDDSPETLRLLTDALDGAGMTVMVAMDGAAAMRIVEQITPDIVLLDAVMPGIDGFETTTLIKRDPALAPIPIIFMTGHGDISMSVRAISPIDQPSYRPNLSTVPDGLPGGGPAAPVPSGARIVAGS